MRKAIVVFFSKEGENFVNGKKQILTIGNTEIVAKKISEALDSPIAKLQPIISYPTGYEETLERSKKERQENSMICYQNLGIDWKAVETVFLGFPNWWGSCPQIVKTFLKESDWSKKTIYPFCTHEGSGFGSSIQELKKQYPNAKIKCGLPIRGSRVDRSDTAIKNWLFGIYK